MISSRLLLACFLWGGLALLFFELIWYWAEKKINLLSRLPSSLVEETGVVYFLSKFVMQFGLLVALPTVVYGQLYVLVPFYGTRAGIGMALFLYLLGIVPFVIALLARIKLPLAYVFFQLAGYLIKLTLIYGIIAYLYVL